MPIIRILIIGNERRIQHKAQSTSAFTQEQQPKPPLQPGDVPTSVFTFGQDLDKALPVAFHHFEELALCLKLALQFANLKHGLSRPCW